MRKEDSGKAEQEILNGGKPMNKDDLRQIIEQAMGKSNNDDLSDEKTVDKLRDLVDKKSKELGIKGLLLVVPYKHENGTGTANLFRAKGKNMAQLLCNSAVMITAQAIRNITGSETKTKEM